MRIAAFFSLLFLPMSTPAADFEKAIPPACGQMVMVTTADWSASAATVRRFERVAAEAPWVAVGKAMPALLGERGLAWGMGLHAMPRDAVTRKREGDRRSPAGVFRITEAFGAAGKIAGLNLPAWTLTPTLEAVDDPASRFYNRIVDRAKIAQPDWRSAERMGELPDYALGFVIAQNPRRVPGAGSCIFFHLWSGKRRGTAGCTVLRERDLTVLVRWLDAARAPVLVQLPEAEVPRAISARGS
jgi:L,D-peptidoglycan transpeptidase YkuD (ErfK/YbiS/YcfS/YnhG family)